MASKRGSIERRGDRRPLPKCEKCGQSEVTVASRTDYVLYLRCAACCHVWSIPKPGGLKLGE